MIDRRRALQCSLGALATLMVGGTLDADAQPTRDRPVRSTEIFRHALPNIPGKEVVVIGMSELRMVTQKARPGGFGNGEQPPTPTWSLQRTVLVTGLESAGNK